MRYTRLVLTFTILLFTGAACGFFAKPPADGGVLFSPDRGETFQQRNFITQNGDEVVTLNRANISQLLFHPVDADIIYAATFGAGVYKTTSAGQQWTPTGLASGTVTRLVIDPITPSTLYGTNSRSIFKTVDAGSTWSEVYIETRRDQMITDLAIDPTVSARIVATTNTGAILVSTDFGGTWDVQQRLNRGIRRIIYHPRTSQTYYLLTTDQHLLRTRDGGSTFDDLNEQWKGIVASAGTLYQLTFRPSAPETLYLATAYGLLQSVDSGDTWVLLNTLVQPNTVPITHVALDTANPLALYFIAGRTLHRSLDAGKEWAVRSIPTTRQITQLLLDPDEQSTLYLGTRLIE